MDPTRTGGNSTELRSRLAYLHVLLVILGTLALAADLGSYGAAWHRHKAFAEFQKSTQIPGRSSPDDQSLVREAERLYFELRTSDKSQEISALFRSCFIAVAYLWIVSSLVSAKWRRHGKE